MIKFRWRGQTDASKWSGLLKLERNVDKQTTEFVKEAADWLVNDTQGIIKNWSASSPSAPGATPAMDTKNLNSAILKALDNARFRGAKGQFAGGKNAKTMTMRFAAAEGKMYHGRGEYIKALEKGHGSTDARPFLEPAIERLKLAFPKLAKQKIKG